MVGGGARFALRVLERAGDAINGRPRGVRGIHRAIVESGIQPGPRVAHDGWGATVALPSEDLQMTHSLVNHARGGIVAEDTDAPFPEEMCFSPTNSEEEKWGATKRRMGGKCGGKLPCVGEWGPYAREFQWREWFAGPYVPLLVDTVDARGRGIHEASLEADTAEAREFRGANVIDLLESDDEFRERPPKCACVV